eukprot:m.297741 g.297741  ORF g.297741 m.297741 type:complete len:243 (+) comp55170_c0_seq2:1303-2031(+)
MGIADIRNPLGKIGEFSRKKKSLRKNVEDGAVDGPHRPQSAAQLVLARNGGSTSKVIQSLPWHDAAVLSRGEVGSAPNQVAVSEVIVRPPAECEHCLLHERHALHTEHQPSYGYPSRSSEFAPSPKLNLSLATSRRLPSQAGHGEQMSRLCSVGACCVGLRCVAVRGLTCGLVGVHSAVAGCPRCQKVVPNQIAAVDSINHLDKSRSMVKVQAPKYDFVHFIPASSASRSSVSRSSMDCVIP